MTTKKTKKPTPNKAKARKSSKRRPTARRSSTYGPTRAEFTRGQVHRIVSEIRAKYDAAATTDENRKHWAQADDLSANAANSAEIRRTLRRRARYERDNSSYCKGIVSTLAGDLIGTGPRLQMISFGLTYGPDREESADRKTAIRSRLFVSEAKRTIAREFALWCDEVNLAGKLRQMESSRHVDGESFALFVSNPKLAGPVKLDLRVIEADQVETPDYRGDDPLAVSGVRFDKWGNPAFYDILQSHPGDWWSAYGSGEYKSTPAAEVLHWFVSDRPGQARGIPTYTPAIPLFAQLRRYCLAVLCSAEIAAELAAFVQSNTPPGEDDPGPDPFELLEIVRGQITTLPQGWGINQLNPTQPTTAFGDFVEHIIKEIARCLNMPWGLAGGDSSSYNYSSGRLDIQTYVRNVIKVTRADIERRIVDRIFTAWLEEAVLINGFLPIEGLGPHRGWRWQWHWDQFGHVDPSKEATAIQTLLTINATTMSRIYAERGEDWQEAFEQLALEKEEMERLGLGPPKQPSAPAGGDPSPADAEDGSADDGSAEATGEGAADAADA